MGANDAKEMLEVAKQVNLEMEQGLAAQASAALAIRRHHSPEQFGDCIADGQKYPCVTVQILDTAHAHEVNAGRANPGYFTPHLVAAALEAYTDEGLHIWLTNWALADEAHRHTMETGVIAEWSGQPPAPVGVPEMKILTVKQPWAYALVNGWKDVENRSWSTQYRGPVAIHAGLRVDEEWESAYPADQLRPPYIHGLTRGAIVGVADLVDVIDDSQSPWAEHGQFHWVFANAREIEPIAHTGSLGLRVLDAEIADQLKAQFGGTE